MKNIDKKSTGQLIQIINDVSSEAEYKYAAERTLINRWQKEIDIDLLINMISSEKSIDRINGSYYIGELSGNMSVLRECVVSMAVDPLPTCRRAFVNYIISSGSYDNNIANALARCLLDISLQVRVATIRWASGTSAERFEEFCRLVESGAGNADLRFPNPVSYEFWENATKNRATRGLNIIRYMRSGNDIEQIKAIFQEEDSFVLDSLIFFMTSASHSRGWQEIRSRKRSDDSKT